MEGDAARAGVGKDASLRRFAPRLLHRHESLDDAFERFYRKHVAEVYQYALAVLGNSADAEDVTQQTFLNAYRAFQRGGQPTKPHNWLIKIAHNVCRMRWRQSGRRPNEVPLENAPEPAAPEHDDNLSLDEVLTALARLPFNQRAAIVMREVEDRSYAEIADVLGVTVPAVEALLFRARGSLRARRKAVAGTLGVVPLPASLGSFFGGGSGGLIAAGGAALGSEVAVKVAAVVATGVVAGGLGYKSVDAVARPDAAPTRIAQVRHEPRAYAPTLLRRSSKTAPARSAIDVGSFRHSRSAVTGQGAPRKAPTNDPVSGDPVSSDPVSAGGASAASEPQHETPPSPQPAATAASTVGTVTAPVASVTTAVPTSTTVSTPILTVSVTVPTVPLPPPPHP
jgi:RNA polymerase sigma-70 factor, ECF subfamily